MSNTKPVWTISETAQPDGLYHVRDENGKLKGWLKTKPLARRWINEQGATFAARPSRPIF